MREVKFKVWDKNKKIFLPKDVYAILPNSNNIFVMLRNFEDYREGEFGNENSFDINQYTGLNDKNGKEIYEGDICKYSNRIDGDGVCIIRDDHVQWISGTIAKKNILTALFYLRRGSEYEIIGNIYENPNLLQGTK